MICFAGDTHGEEDRFSPEAMPGESDFGHFHIDEDIDEKHHAMFYRVLTAEGSEINER